LLSPVPKCPHDTPFFYDAQLNPWHKKKGVSKDPQKKIGLASFPVKFPKGQNFGKAPTPKVLTPGPTPGI